jgi:hypothetical protein
VITVAVRWYLRYGLSYRDVEELLAERGVTVDHVSVYRWVQRFTGEFIDAARPCRSPSPTLHWLSEPATSSAQAVCRPANAAEPPGLPGRALVGDLDTVKTAKMMHGLRDVQLVVIVRSSGVCVQG